MQEDQPLTQPRLNAAQRAAVETASGPLLVLAGAGTGKTRVVTHRIARLIRGGVPPERILAVTFTNKAAREMRDRVRALVRLPSAQRPTVCTFHSHCVQVLRRHAERLGYPRRFLIALRDDQESYARAALREVRVPETLLAPRDLVAIIGRWKTRGVAPAAAARQAASDREHLAAAAYRRYQDALRQAAAVDFDDLLLLSLKVLAEHDDVRASEAGRWRQILIDEYQDTNRLQYQIVRHLALPHRNLCVVGDDDQSIYGWRGAEVQHILNFKRDWPDARVIRLEQNYRSTGEILNSANRLIAFNSHRHVKELRSTRPDGPPPRVLQAENETREAHEVVREIRRLLERPGVRLNHIAILARTHEQPRPFEAELRAARLPYVLVGGQSFFDRKEVKDAIAYLRLIDQPHDDLALRRVINTPPRGFGKATVLRLAEQSLARQTSFWELLSDPGCSVTQAARRGFAQLHQAVSAARQTAAERGLVDAAVGLLRDVGYRGEIDRAYDDPDERQARWDSVEQVVNALGAYVADHPGQPQLGDFLDQLALADQDFGEQKDGQLERDAIALMTLHSAKGLEFPFVFLVGMEEGLLPHRRSLEEDPPAIDEERRLCYVGMTRAQDELTLSLSLSRMKWGKPRETQPSRFLYELTGRAEHPNYRRLVESA